MVSGLPAEACPFCAISADLSVATTKIVTVTRYEMVMEPLDPVTPGHLIVVSRQHLAHFAADPTVFAHLAYVAAGYVRDHRDPPDADVDAWNLITSMGDAATQTIGHLHIHLVPRRPGDGLKLPWSPTVTT